MSLPSWQPAWLRALTSDSNRRGRSGRRPSAQRSRPGLEALEDRFVPALLTPTAVQPAFVIDHLAVGKPANALAVTPVGYTPVQMRTAYGVNNTSLNGAGQTIAIVDAFNDPKVFSDLDVFDKQFATTASGNTLFQQYGAASSFLTVYNQSGQVINPSNTTVPIDSTGNWELEESLDVQWAHTMAPGAKIVLIEASNNNAGLYTGVQSAAKLPGVSVVSMSWGSAEFQGETSNDSTFTTPAGHTGVTFLASAGDNSAGLYPAFSPNVIAVGGTTLTLSATNTIQSETAWSTGSDSWNLTLGTGGGTSTYETQPAYQQGLQNTGKRTIPDVSFDADPNTGVAVYDSFETATAPAAGWEKIGGTSLGSPAWGGIIAVANQERAQAGLRTLNSTSSTQAQTYLYNLSGVAFHDITSGSITANGHTYTAGVGYDEVTGLGTPFADRIVNGLSGTLDLVGDQSQTNQNDTFTIGTTASGGLQVTIDGKTESFAAGLFTTVNLNAGGGTNTVQITALPRGVTLNLDSVAIHTDTVTIGGGSLANIAGTVNVSNNSGSTTLTVDGSHDSTFRDYQVRAGSVTASGMPGTVNYSGDTTALTVLGGPGGNEMDVYSTSATVPVSLDGGLATNTIFVHKSSSAVSTTGEGTNYVTIGADGSLVGIAGPVNVNNSYNSNTGAYGKSYVTIDDTTDTVGRNVTISSSSIAFAGLTTINLNDPTTGTSHVQGVTINDALHVANHYTVNSVQASDPVTINGDTLDTLSGPAEAQVSFHSTAHNSLGLSVAVRGERRPAPISPGLSFPW